MTISPKQITDIISHATSEDMPEGVQIVRNDIGPRRSHDIIVGSVEVGRLVMPPIYSSGPAAVSVHFEFNDQESQIHEMLARIHTVMQHRRNGEKGEARAMLEHLARPIPAT